MKVAIFLANGFEEIEAITVIDVLRRAEIEIDIISLSGAKTVIGAHKIQIVSEFAFDFIKKDDYDMLVLPGGMGGVLALKRSDELKVLLGEYIKQGKYIAAICAAPMIFGELGLLADKNATCYPGLEKHMRGANYLTEKVVVSDKIITSRSVATAIDFALKIVEILGGEELEATIRKGLAQ